MSASHRISGPYPPHCRWGRPPVDYRPCSSSASYDWTEPCLPGCSASSELGGHLQILNSAVEHQGAKGRWLLTSGVLYFKLSTLSLFILFRTFLDRIMSWQRCARTTRWLLDTGIIYLKFSTLDEFYLCQLHLWQRRKTSLDCFKLLINVIKY